jgi:hypothetical protein
MVKGKMSYLILLCYGLKLYIAQAGLKPSSSCLNLPHARITGTHHEVQLTPLFYKGINSFHEGTAFMT